MALKLALSKSKYVICTYKNAYPINADVPAEEKPKFQVGQFQRLKSLSGCQYSRYYCPQYCHGAAHAEQLASTLKNKNNDKKSL